MASPVLSRSPSATFAPGPHRRSHPNLQNLHHLSLAPLTPKYPIDPADYDAYYDPNTSELHTSSSISHISGLPSPVGILTNSPARSRNPSRTRRKIKSTVHIQIPNDESGKDKQDHASKDHEVTDYKPLPKPKPKSKSPTSKSQPHLSKLHTDPSWLVQTGLSLTESSRETKGQSWISKRDSSTSLANAPVEAYIEISKRPREGRTPRSGRATPARSRVTSRNVSRNASRTRLSDLRMTATSPESSKVTPHASFTTAQEVYDKIHKEVDEGYEDIEPHRADARTQAEVAAHSQSDLADEYEIEGLGDDGDPYGMLNFEDQGESEDERDAEEEVRRAMRSWRVGGWMDGAIEALLMVEEDKGSGEDMESAMGRERELEEGSVGGDAEAPEDIAKGSWSDLWWFGRVVRRQVDA